MNGLPEHLPRGMLRFIVCGSVDDGKSTLIGRLLYDSKSIMEDQMEQFFFGDNAKLPDQFVPLRNKS